tara:strand:- start:1493 stop:1699 length:207 start_codon:yes stop_codon:yes gene_type:complete
MSDQWELQVKQILDSLTDLKKDVRENKDEVTKLKVEMSTGKGALRAVAWIGSILIIIFTTLRLINYNS